MIEHAHEHYEPGRVHTSYVLLAAAGCFGLMIGAVWILYLIYTSAVPHPQPEAPRVFPAPRLEANPAAELHRLLARQRKELSRYHWADKEHTLIAIPIDQAMKLIAQRGDKAFDPIPSAPKMPAIGTALQGAPAAPKPGTSGEGPSMQAKPEMKP